MSGKKDIYSTPETRPLLSVEERAEYIIEYFAIIKGTNQKFSTDTVYKGYKIGDPKGLYYLNKQYHAGNLNLSPEKKRLLKQHGILRISKEEKERIKNQYGIEEIDAEKILKEHESIESFILKYKRRECEFGFNKKSFIGARCVAISIKDMTVLKKRNYYELYFACNHEVIGLNQYLDIDALEEAISELTEEEQLYLRIRFGLDDGILKTQTETGRAIGISLADSRKKEQDVFRRLSQLLTKKNAVIEIQTDNTTEQFRDKEKELFNLEILLMRLTQLTCLEAKVEKWECSGIKLSPKVATRIYNVRNEKNYQMIIKMIEKEYFRILKEYIRRKEILERSQKKQSEHQAIYRTAENEYLYFEDIFNPHYIIKGIEFKKTNLPEANQSICELPVSIMALVHLHHCGFNTIEDLLNKAGRQEWCEKYLNSIEGLDEEDKEKIIQYVSENYQNDENSTPKSEKSELIEELIEMQNTIRGIANNSVERGRHNV